MHSKLKENSMPNNLQGRTIAILATDGFEQAELTKPKKALEEAGARTQVVSPTEKKIKGWDRKGWGDDVQVDVPLKSADPPSTTRCSYQAE
jgi:protease I